jgi:ferredoxin
MNILTLISRNLRRAPGTLRLPERVVPAERFRGLVRNQTDKCIACGICDHVCVSGAIVVTGLEDHCEWRYDPGACTFCGRCVDHCPGGALTQEEDRAPTYSLSGGLTQDECIAYPACPQCGLPARPYNERMLSIAHDDIGPEFRARIRLCERCRRRRSQTVLKKGFGGNDDGRNDDGS